MGLNLPVHYKLCTPIILNQNTVKYVSYFFHYCLVLDEEFIEQ